MATIAEKSNCSKITLAGQNASQGFSSVSSLSENIER
ncbi:hypothetical protein ACVWZM_004517 [Bradyrhizobium sp. USDA 4501]